VTDAPQDAEAAYAAGQAAQRDSDFEAAAGHYRRAIALDPGHAAALRDLAFVLLMQSRFFEAEAAYRRALEVHPRLRSARANLAYVLSVTGRLDEALALYRDLLARTGDAPDIFSSYLFALTHSSKVTREAVYAEHLRFGEAVARRAPPPVPHLNTPDPERRLKIGYVSADLGRHIAGRMIEGVLPAHDRRLVEVTVYDNAPANERPAIPTGHVDHWIQVRPFDDAAFAQRVRADGIDILVDLSGHTGGNRLATFAYKAAPVQASWFGYPFTTGVSAIDYRICDAFQLGPGTAELLVEQPFVIEGASVAFLPTDDPPPAPPPSVANGHVTFGSMSSLDKVDEAVLALWAELLKAVPSSRLLMKARGLHDPRLQAHFAQAITRHGVAADRLAFEGGSPVRAFLESFSRIDIALDSFPYTGGSTTRYTLWMGVPVITLEGAALYERFSGAILRQIGLAECVASDPAGYVAAAAALAGDPSRLLELRKALRPRLKASALCDVPGHARRLEAAYREMWRRWCARQRDTAGP